MLAMDVLGPFWVGVILASIFAATMSTADSQVLACTAAITDDLIPEWSQDHSKTKLTTVTMAILATSISLGALWTENNSVFSLVVLAVYGLGGIFIPLLIVRFSGYQPSSSHSIIMMVSALVAVIGWRYAGFNNDVFESVPGMGAAFIAHFTMLIVNKDPWLTEKMPSKDTLITVIGIIIACVVAMELWYFM